MCMLKRPMTFYFSMQLIFVFRKLHKSECNKESPPVFALLLNIKVCMFHTILRIGCLLIIHKSHSALQTCIHQSQTTTCIYAGRYTYLSLYRGHYGGNMAAGVSQLHPLLFSSFSSSFQCCLFCNNVICRVEWKQRYLKIMLLCCKVCLRLSGCFSWSRLMKS